jgi:hypothetical protein
MAKLLLRGSSGKTRVRSYLTGRMSHANHEDKNVEISSSLRQQPVSPQHYPPLAWIFVVCFVAQWMRCACQYAEPGAAPGKGGGLQLSAFVAQWS